MPQDQDDIKGAAIGRQPDGMDVYTHPDAIKAAMKQAPTPGPLSAFRVDLGLVATTIETMHRRIEDLTGSRQSQYDGAVALARDLYLSAPTAPVEASGSELHPATADLVDRFADELKSKLAKAEAKYGYRDDWSKPDWKDDLIKSLAEHVQKGDPRDVAAYCAFAWHHGWSTSEVPDCFHRAPRPTDVVQALEPFAKAARMAGINSHNKPNLEQEAKRAVSWLDFSRAAKAIELIAAQPDTAPVEASGSEREDCTTREWADRCIAKRVAGDLFAKADRTANKDPMRSETVAGLREDGEALMRLAARPQPSGETREAVARLVDPSAWRRKDEGHPGGENFVKKSLRLADRILALLSARPLASGGQQGKSDEIKAAYKRGWNDRESDIIERAERIAPMTTPARAEALDEGAATRGWDREICTGCSSSLTISHIKEGGFVSCCPDRRMVKVSDLVDAFEASRRAHPSPTPAADADRVRIAVEALEPFADFVTPAPKWMKDVDVVSAGSPLARKQLTFGDCRRAAEALAALKSTAAKEGGES